MAKRQLINGTPSGLIPKVGEYSVHNVATYQQLLITDAPADATDIATLVVQIDPFAAKTDDADPMPAVGVLLTFEQGWYQKGVALGELRKSITLAPGEVTKVATVDWRRTMRSVDEATRSQQETTSADTDDASSANSVQRAVLDEATHGVSTNSSFATQTEASGSIGGLFGGGSMSGGSNLHLGHSAAASTGSRDASSTAVANIARTTEKHAQAARSTRATQIREVTEDETQTTSVRVLANYNHAHALTMQYYEVLQIYSIETRVARADRCVFIPMQLFSFTKENMDPAIESPDPNLGQFTDKMIELLRRTLRELDMRELDELVGLHRMGSYVVPDTSSASAESTTDTGRVSVEVAMSPSLGTAVSTSRWGAAVSSTAGVGQWSSVPGTTVDIGREVLKARVAAAETPVTALGDEIEAADGALEALRRARNAAVRAIQSVEAKITATQQQRTERAASLTNNAPIWKLIGVTGLDFESSDPVMAQLAAEQVQFESQLDELNDDLRELAADRVRVEGVRARYERDSAVAQVALDREVALLEAYPRVFGLLEKQNLMLNQQMWMRINAHTWHGLLADYEFPSGADVARTETDEDHEYAGHPIGGLVNPEPIGFFGSYVAFMWDFPPLGAEHAGRLDPAVEFERRYIDNSHKSAAKTVTQSTIALPTEGVFAEAVLGRSNAAEKIDLTRFWNWQDSLMPIRPPDMGPVNADTRARDVLLPKALEFEKAIAQLQDMAAEDLTDDAKLLAALRNSVGPDLRALSKAATEAGTTAAKNSAEGAHRAQERALEHQRNMHETVVGLANSEVVKTAGAAVGGGEGLAGLLGGGGGGGAGAGGLSSLGGLINQADGGDEGGGVIDLAKKLVGGAGSAGGA